MEKNFTLNTSGQTSVQVTVLGDIRHSTGLISEQLAVAGPALSRDHTGCPPEAPSNLHNSVILF